MSRPQPKAQADQRIALYVRVSDSKQLAGKEFDSLESQEVFLREQIARLGGEIVAVYRDTESAAKAEPAKRPGFMQLLADAHAGKFDVATAYNFDRWHRNVETYGVMKRVSRETGVRFISATQEFGDDAEGQFMEGQISVVNAYYSAVISKKVRIKRKLRADRGEWNGGRRPLGYGSEHGRLFLIPDEAKAVAQVFDLYLEHPSATTVRNRLRALGIKNPRTGEWWSNSSIETMIRNPVYAGFVRHPDGDPVPGIHDPVVTQDVWRRAQDVAPTRKRLVTKVQRPFPLVGLIECGACGVGMTMHYVSKKNGLKIGYYRCSRTFHRGWKDCPIRQVNADRMEAWVVSKLRQLGADGDLLDAAIAEANQTDQTLVQPLRDEEAGVAKRMKQVQAKIDKFLDAVADGGSAFSSLRARLTMEERNLRLLEADMSRIRTDIARLAGDGLDPNKLRRVLSDFDALYTVASVAERKELLRLLIRRIVFRGPEKEVTLELYSSVNLNVPGSKFEAFWLRRTDSNRRPGG